MRIELSTSDTAHAARLAQQRHQASLASGLQGRFGGPTDGAASQQVHLVGAVGECVVAKMLGLAMPDTVNTFKAPDLSRAVQVRTRTKPEYELIVRASDNPNEAYVLVTYVDDHTGVVRGFIQGWAAQRPEFSRSHGGRAPAYFVPTSWLYEPQYLGLWIDHGSVAPLENEISWGYSCRPTSGSMTADPRRLAGR